MNFPEGFPRLGYACLNSELREQKPSVFCSRTCRIASIKPGPEGLQMLQELSLKNVADLKKMLNWNAQHGIHFMRMSSGLFPFASHNVHGYNLDFCATELAEAGKLAKDLGQRLTFHPGQTNNLGSPYQTVVAATKRDLTYHAAVLDGMNLDKDSVMIIHGGGMYGDKKETLKRFALEFAALDDAIKKRLVIENDELCYSVDDLLPMSEELQLPIVFDWHHHSLNPGHTPIADLLQRIKAVWRNRGIRCKMHYSESRAGASSLMERRAHSTHVSRVPLCGEDVDLMIEAKATQDAVLKMMEKYGNPAVLPVP